MATRIRNSRAQALINDIDTGVDSGSIYFYDGIRPDTGDTATSLIGTNVFSKPSASVDTGLIVFNLINDDLSVDNTGEITWCRVFNGDGQFVIDMDCGISGSGAEVIFDDVDAIKGGTLKILTAYLLEGNL